MAEENIRTSIAHRIAVNAYRAIYDIARATGISRWRMGNRRTLGGVVGPLVRRVVALTMPDRPVLIRGHRMVLPRESDLSAWYLTDSFEQGVTELFEQSLREGMTVIDGGANIGYYTLLAARCVGRSGRVYAFEPSSDNYALLLRNIELSGYTNVVPVRKALGAQSGKAALYLRDSARHSLHPAPSDSDGSELVDVVTLDDFLEEKGSPEVDLIKLDLQGSEPAAVAGMRRLLERSQDLRLVLQLDRRLLEGAGVNADVFLQDLRQAGFDVTVLDDVRRLAPDASQVLSTLEGEAFNVLCQRAAK